MTSEHAARQAAHWKTLTRDADRLLVSLDVGSEKWCEFRAWRQECYARADVWTTVADSLEAIEKGVAA